MPEAYAESSIFNMLPVEVVLRRTVVAVDQQGVLHLRESQLPRFGDLIHDRLVAILDWWDGPALGGAENFGLV